MSDGAATRRRTPQARKTDGEIFRLPPTTSRPALSAGGSDRRFRQLLYDLSVLGTRLAALRAIIAPVLRLTPPQYNLLMVVAQYQGASGVGVGDVAAHLHVSGAFITAEANKLTRRGMMAKHANPEDGRGVLLQLSAAAEAAIDAASPFIRDINDRVFGALTRSDFTVLSEVIARLVDSATATAAWASAAAPAGPRVAARRRNAR